MAAKKKTPRKAAVAKKSSKPRREEPTAKPSARRPVAKAAPAAPPRGESGLVYTSALRELVARRLGR